MTNPYQNLGYNPYSYVPSSYAPSSFPNSNSADTLASAEFFSVGPQGSTSLRTSQVGLNNLPPYNLYPPSYSPLPSASVTPDASPKTSGLRVSGSFSIADFFSPNSQPIYVEGSAFIPTENVSLDFLPGLTENGGNSTGTTELALEPTLSHKRSLEPTEKKEKPSKRTASILSEEAIKARKERNKISSKKTRDRIKAQTEKYKEELKLFDTMVTRIEQQVESNKNILPSLAKTNNDPLAINDLFYPILNAKRPINNVNSSTSDTPSTKETIDIDRSLQRERIDEIVDIAIKTARYYKECALTAEKELAMYKARALEAEGKLAYLAQPFKDMPK